jgi:hypothetical protein
MTPLIVCFAGWGWLFRARLISRAKMRIDAVNLAGIYCRDYRKRKEAVWLPFFNGLL